MKETLKELQFRKFSYFGWAAVAFKQILYVLLGQMNHHLDLYVYLPYVPQINEFVHVWPEEVITKRKNLLFSEVKGTEIVDYSGIRYWSSDYPTKDDLMKLPSARIAGYMGVPDLGSPFKIHGLHILELGTEGDKIFKNTGGSYSDFLSSVERGVLPAYVNSKLVNRESGEVRITHLRINVQFFEDTFATMHLIDVNAALWQES